ncbi:MAG: gliding motility-associated C-terminal domain-containing protein [Chitinophagales bacterium]
MFKKFMYDDISIQNPSYLNQLGAGRINAFSSLQCLSPLPHTDFSSDYQELCPGQTIQFKDLSVGNPTSWAWQFQGGESFQFQSSKSMVTYPNPGIYNVGLSATNGMGNDAKVNNAYIHHVAIPNATLSGNASINLGSTSFLRFDFTGSAPYSLSFSDGINTTNLSGINSNPYYHAVSPTQTTNYLLTAMSSAFCAGSIAGLASIDVGQANTACTILYQKLIDDQGNMDNLNLIQCLNGDYLLAGYTNQSNAQNDVFVARFDSNFDLLWSRGYGTPFLGGNTGNERSLTVPIIEMNDGSLIVGCESNTYGTRPDAGILTILRLQASGGIIWQKRLNSNVDYCHARALYKVGDEFIICGSAGGAVTPGVFDDGYIVRMDLSGNVLYSEVLLGSSNDHIHEIVLNDAQEVLSVGNSLSFGPSRTPIFYKFDNAGNFLFAKSYEYNHHLSFYAIEESVDNNYWLLGADVSASSNSFHLLKVNENGDLLNAFQFDGVGVDWANDLELLDDGSLLLSGYTNSFGNGGYDLFVTKVDANANELWTKIYGGIADEELYTSARNLLVNQTENYGMVVINSNSYGGANVDALVVKFSLDTDTLCGETLGSFWARTTSNPSVVNRSYIHQDMPNFIPATFSENNKSFVVSTICEVDCPIIPPIDSSCVVYYQSFFDDNGISKNFSNLLTSDGGYLVSGMTTAFGFGQEEIVVSKFDVNDNLEWTKSYGSSSKEFSYTTPMVELPGGGYIIAFESNLYSDRNDAGNLVFMRLDTQGNILWQKAVEQYTNTYTHSSDMILDGNFIYIMGSKGPGASTYVLKSDFNGNVVWTQIVSIGGIDHGLSFADVNNKLYVVGSTSAFGSTSNRAGVLFEMEKSNGQVNWLKTYNISTGVEQIIDITATIDNSLIVCGHTSDDNFVMKLDFAGNVLWCKKYQLIGIDAAVSIEALSDGNYIVAGHTQGAGFGMADVFMTKIDALGNEQWTKLFGGVQNESLWNSDEFLSVNEVEGYALLSFPTKSYGGLDDDLLICKPSLDDEVVCGELINQIWNQSNLSISGISRSFTYSTLPSPINSIMQAQSLSLNTIILCETVCDSILPNICTNLKLDTFLCNQDTLVFSAPLGTSYNWSPNYAISSVSSPNPIFYPSVSTSYILEFIALDSCHRFDTLNIQVDTSQVRILSPSDTSVCIGQSVDLWASGASLFSWSPSTNLNASNLAHVVYNATASEEIVVTGLSAFLCETSDTVLIDVLSCCGAQSDIRVVDTTICINDSALFINNSIYSTNPIFTWNFGLDAQPNSYIGINPPPVKFTTPGIHWVEVILEDDCGRDTSWVLVNVLDLPEAKAIDDTSFCTIDTIQVQIGALMNPDYQYLWTPSLGLNDVNIADPLASITNSITYVLKVEDIFSCFNFDTVNIELVQSVYSIEVSPVACSDSVLIYVSPNSFDSLIWNNNTKVDTLILELYQDSLINLQIFDASCYINQQVLVEDSFETNSTSLTSFEICQGDTLLLDAGLGTNYTWTPDYNISSIIGQSNAIWPYYDILYTVSYNSDNCLNIDSFEVLVNDYPSIQTFSPIYANPAELISLEVLGGSQWEWSPSELLSCIFCQNPEYLATQDQIFIVSSANGNCIAFDSVEVILVDSLSNCGRIPSAFSPNGDGVNDKFSLVDDFGHAEMLRLRIFNRWGELLYDSPEPWDGTYKGEDQCLCTYIYIVEYNCSGETKLSSGNLTIIR